MSVAGKKIQQIPHSEISPTLPMVVYYLVFVREKIILVFSRGVGPPLCLLSGRSEFLMPQALVGEEVISLCPKTLSLKEMIFFQIC